MANEVLKIIELTSEKVVCSVNVTDPLQVAKNPAYGINDAYITVWREYRGNAGWDGLRVTFVNKNGNSSTVRTMRCSGTRFELVMSVICDIEKLVRQKGLSLYGRSMKPYKMAKVSAVYGDRWWGTLYDEFGRELNLGCIGKQSEMGWSFAMGEMLDAFCIPYYGPEYAYRHEAYSGPYPYTNCTYYVYDVDEATCKHNEIIEMEN